MLGIDQGTDKAAVRTAYVEKMKLLHPDVNLKKDTTAEAAAVVAAYKHILEVSFKTISATALGHIRGT